MCGILAISGNKLEKGSYDTARMLDALKQRGPDGPGEIAFDGCWLGHQRLSIIDRDGGAQPMVVGNHTISFNGEIYNHEALRAEFEKGGHVFRSKSDTEVILAAYEKWGAECPKYLDGMFTFVIWDDDKKELFVARDRLGKKPLYYYIDRENILVASEIKALLASGIPCPAVDNTVVDAYLRVKYVPPWQSVYTDIHALPPAYCGTFKDGSIQTHRYWKLNHTPSPVSYEEAKHEVRRLLKEAVKKRVRSSDVEIGAFLSGGLDSTLVTLLAAEELGHPPKLFSARYKAQDELLYARQVAEKIGTELAVVDIDEMRIPEFEKVVGNYDEPTGNTTLFASYFLAKLASEQVRVVLSGDGADELFMGYRWHLREEGVDPLQKRLNICAFDTDLREKLWGTREWINEEIFYKDISVEGLEKMDAVALYEMTSYLPGMMIPKNDRVGMMHGLEVRSPFMDTALVEYVYNLPYEYKVRNGVQKSILKDILAEYMPAEFANRPKQGFGGPISTWLLSDAMKPYVLRTLGDGAEIRSLLSGGEIDTHLAALYENEAWTERAAHRVWTLLCLEVWACRYQKTCAPSGTV